MAPPNSQSERMPKDVSRYFLDFASPKTLFAFGLFYPFIREERYLGRCQRRLRRCTLFTHEQEPGRTCTVYIWHSPAGYLEGYSNFRYSHVDFYATFQDGYFHGYETAFDRETGDFRFSLFWMKGFPMGPLIAYNFNDMTVGVRGFYENGVLMNADSNWDLCIGYTGNLIREHVEDYMMMPRITWSPLNY